MYVCMYVCIYDIGGCLNADIYHLNKKECYLLILCCTVNCIADLLIY